MHAQAAARRMIGICRALIVSAGIASALHVIAADPARGNVKAAPCGACHGTGSNPPQAASPLLAGQQREFLVLQMFYMREGLRDVPQMAGMLAGFSDGDLEDVAAFYSTQPLPQAPAGRDAALHARGAALSQALGCGSCHLSDYSGQKHVPRIANQREDYLLAALKAYRDNKRTGTDTSMNAAMYQVSDGDISAIAHYLAHR